MRLSTAMHKMLTLAREDEDGRIWAADAPGDAQSQSAWWRTAKALETRGLLTYSRSHKGERLEGMTITAKGREAANV